MIRGAFKRMVITELYARVIVTAILAAVASLGVLASGHLELAACLAGLALLPVIYRLKYKRW
jgi:hypothetical protein